MVYTGGYMEICFYHINNDYINFLKKYEREQVGHTCVPNIQYKTSDEFVFGAVMDINGMSYFVPVSSYSKNQTDVILIRDKKNKSDILGSLRFAYMLPVPRSCLIKLDINSITNEYSKVHISKELAFCRRERDKIFKQAEKTYFRVINKVDKQLVKNSCDFKVLEQAYAEYCIINKLEYPQVAKQNIDEGDLKFINETQKMKEWSEAVHKKYEERMAEFDEQNKNNSER